MSVSVFRLQRFLHSLRKVCASDHRENGHHLFHLDKWMVRAHLAYRQTAGIRNLYSGLSQDHGRVLSDPVLVDLVAVSVLFALHADRDKLLRLLRREQIRSLLLYVIEESFIIAFHDKGFLLREAQNVLEAIKVLAAEGIPINATEVMSVSQVLAVCEAAKEATKNLDKPPVIYFSLITGIFDEYLGNYVRDNGTVINPDILGQASYVLARKVYDLVHAFRYDIGIICGGARGLHHFTDMVGANVSITINWKGTADKLLEADAPVAPTFFQPIPAYTEDVLLETLPDFKKAYMIHGLTADQYEDFGPVVLFRSSFEKAWKNATAQIQKEFDKK